MILEEAEANSKKCPLGVSENCIGKNCMAWSWQTKRTGKLYSVKLENTTRGYCGLCK